MTTELKRHHQLPKQTDSTDKT